MKPKNYFNNELLKNGVVVNAREATCYKRIKAYVQKQPKRTVKGMLLFAILNFGLMVYLVNKDVQASLVPAGIGKNTNLKDQRHIAGAEFSIGNYMRISKLKDSLDYLMKKKSLTGDDSLLFIRICNDYSKLDPTFSEAVTKHLNKNLKSKTQ